MADAYFDRMRVALATMDSNFGEAEARRRDEIHTQRQKTARAKSRERLKTTIFTSVRRGLSLLIMVALLSYAFTHQEQIQKLVSTTLVKVMGGQGSSAALRQTAVSHENEINQVAQ